jgi:hypothetical protein
MATDEIGQQTERRDLVRDSAFDAGDIGQRTARGEVTDVTEHDRQGRHRDGEDDQCAGVGRPRQRLLDALGGIEPVELGCLDPVDRPVVAEDLATGRGRRPHH